MEQPELLFDEDVIGVDPIEMVDYVIPNPIDPDSDEFDDTYEGTTEDGEPVKSINGSETMGEAEL